MYNATTRDKLLVIDIYGDIGADWFGEGITAAAVKKSIDAAKVVDRIQVNINSPGGDAFEGIAIKNLLSKQNVPVAVDVDGVAASAASIIAMAGDTITMRAGSMLMIHDAWSICAGNGSDMRKMADTLDNISGAIADCYTQKTGLPLDQIRAMMAEETWLDSETAKQQGFATDIAEDKPKALAMARRFRALAAFRHVPDKFKAADKCACDCQNCIAGDCADCTDKDCNDPNCEDCPMQCRANSQAESNLSLYLRHFELKTGRKFKPEADTETR